MLTILYLLGQCYIHGWPAICSENRWKVCKDLKRRRHKQSSSENDQTSILWCWSVMVWVGVSVRYIFKLYNVTTVMCLHEVLVHIVRFYKLSIGPAAILKDNNMVIHINMIVNDYLDTGGDCAYGVVRVIALPIYH